MAPAWKNKHTLAKWSREVGRSILAGRENTGSGKGRSMWHQEIKKGAAWFNNLWLSN